MRKLSLSLILALACCLPMQAAIFSYVQSAIAINTVTTLAYGSNVTSGDLLVAVTTCAGCTNATSLTDSQSNTWTRLCGSALWTARASTTSANTVTFNGMSGSLAGVIIAEYSSTAANYIVASTNCAGPPSSTTLGSGTALVVPAGVEYMAILFGYDGGSGHSYTTSPATIRQQSGSISGGESIVLCDQDVTGGNITYASPYVTTFSVGVNGAAFSLFMIQVPSGGGGGAASNYGSS